MFRLRSQSLTKMKSWWQTQLTAMMLRPSYKSSSSNWWSSLSQNYSSVKAVLFLMANRQSLSLWGSSDMAMGKEPLRGRELLMWCQRSNRQKTSAVAIATRPVERHLNCCTLLLKDRIVDLPLCFMISTSSWLPTRVEWCVQGSSLMGWWMLVLNSFSSFSAVTAMVKIRAKVMVFNMTMNQFQIQDLTIRAQHHHTLSFVYFRAKHPVFLLLNLRGVVI